MELLGGEYDYAVADVCRLAAESGHLEILQYAVEDGCQWLVQRCIESAEKNRHVHVVNWIRDGYRDLHQQQFLAALAISIINNPVTGGRTS